MEFVIVIRNPAPADFTSARSPRRERGVVLFVALIVMVAMSLAAIALVRSVDTTNRAIGNLAFRQAAIQPAALAVEDAAQALFLDQNKANAVLISNKDADLADWNYYSSWQKSDDVNGIPTKLQKKSNFDLKRTLTDDAGNEIRYVIERMCVQPGPPLVDNCDLMPPKQASGQTTNKENAVKLGRVPFYRVTVRVDGPQNTVSFVQSVLR
jgi:type IV pilus assembly protein PilX